MDGRIEREKKEKKNDRKNETQKMEMVTHAKREWARTNNTTRRDDQASKQFTTTGSSLLFFIFFSFSSPSFPREKVGVHQRCLRSATQKRGDGQTPMDATPRHVTPAGEEGRRARHNEDTTRRRVGGPVQLQGDQSSCRATKPGGGPSLQFPRRGSPSLPPSVSNARTTHFNLVR